MIKKQAPKFIAAKAGASTPWPGRERPLCAYPTAAIADGKGQISCRKLAEVRLPEGAK